MSKKKEFTTVQKQYPVDLLIIITWKYSPQSCYIALLKSAKFTLPRRSFLTDLLRQGKNERKKREREREGVNLL